jgi:hypothetical protein
MRSQNRAYGSDSSMLQQGAEGIGKGLVENNLGNHDTETEDSSEDEQMECDPSSGSLLPIVNGECK